MPGMIPRGARGPGARREGEAHGASARAGARRARQGGRGAGRVPQVRGDAPRVRGARQGRVAEVGPRVLRAHPLAQDHGPARVPRARGGRLGELRRARVRGRDARGVREGLRGVPGHVPARAHGAQRGHGQGARAVPLGPHRLLPGRRHLPQRVAGRQPVQVEGGDAPRAAPLRRRARARHIEPRGVRAQRGGDLGDELCELADRGRPTDEAHGLGPAGRGRGHARLDRRPPGVRPGAAEARRVVPRRDARARGPERRARHGGRDAREARGLPGAPRGVSTRRLGHYLDWFLWDEQTRRSDADRADTLSGQAATGSYDNTRFALAREPQPFWSYWEDKLAVSTVV